MMSSTRKHLTLVAVASSLTLFTACGQEPAMVDIPEAQFAKGGVKGGGKNSGGELAMVGYQVEVLPAGQTHGLTDDEGVNAAVADWLNAYGGVGEPTDPPEIYNWMGQRADGLGTGFFGCPDAGRPCNKITATFSGQDWESIGARVEPSAQGCGVEGQDPPGGCVFDDDLGSQSNAAGWGQSGLKRIERAWLSENSPAYSDNSDGTFSLTWYWQGQRFVRRYDDETGATWHYLLSFFPDLERAGEPDSFVFRFDDGSTIFAAAPRLCIAGTQCWAEYQGRTPQQFTWTVMDGFWTSQSSSGRGKNRTQTVSAGFDIQSFVDPDLRDDTGGVDYTSPDLLAASVDTWHTVMVTSPSGARTIALNTSTGRRPEGSDKAGFSMESIALSLDEGAGCYEVRLLMGYVYDTYVADYANMLNTTSTASDVQGHLAALHYDPAIGLTVQRGVGCSGQ